MEIRVAKLEAIVPTLATREDLAVQTASSMDRLDRTITNLRSDFDRKFSEMDNKFERKFSAMDEKINRKFTEVNKGLVDLRKDIDRKFNFSIGLQFTALVAMLGLITKMANIF